MVVYERYNIKYDTCLENEWIACQKTCWLITTVLLLSRVWIPEEMTIKSQKTIIVLLKLHWLMTKDLRMIWQRRPILMKWQMTPADPWQLSGELATVPEPEPAADWVTSLGRRSTIKRRWLRPRTPCPGTSSWRRGTERRPIITWIVWRASTFPTPSMSSRGKSIRVPTYSGKILWESHKQSCSS